MIQTITKRPIFELCCIGDKAFNACNITTTQFQRPKSKFKAHGFQDHTDDTKPDYKLGVGCLCPLYPYPESVGL
jgi:hypothetical protein